MRLPAGGVLREQGLQLGLHPRQVQPRGVSVPAGVCKKQLTWVRLTNHVRYLCRSRKWLAVPPKLCIDLQAGRPALSPVFASSVLHDQYCFESAVGEAIARGLRSGTAPGVEVLRSCMDAYDYMGNPWGRPWLRGAVGEGPPSAEDVFSDSTLWTEALETQCMAEGAVLEPDLSLYRDDDHAGDSPVDIREHPFTPLSAEESLLVQEWSCLVCRNPTVNLRANRKIELTFLFATGLVRRSRVGCALRNDCLLYTSPSPRDS